MSERRWTDHLVAIFITVHLVMVGLNAIPSPPRVDNRALHHPEVKAELDRFFGQGPLRDRAIEIARTYDRLHSRVTRVTLKWLRPIGSEQHWIMFGGTPPRRPRVMLIEIQPVGETDFTLWRDGRQWGTWSSVGIDFRHRKVQNQLSIRGSQRARSNYAAWWAAQWDLEHPDRPAAAVRLQYAQVTTRTASQVRKGAEPKPEKRVLAFTVHLEDRK